MNEGLATALVIAAIGVPVVLLLQWSWRCAELVSTPDVDLKSVA